MTGRSLTALPEAIGATFETACAFYGAELLAPAAGFVGTAVAHYVLGRLDRGKTIFTSEFSRVGATANDFRDGEQLAAGALRYTRAARDQAPDENLRILAQAMAGLARRHELWANEFLRYAEILAPLTRDELIVIGMMMKAEQDWEQLPDPIEKRPSPWLLMPGIADFFTSGNRNSFDSTPSGPFPNVTYMEAVAAHATRSGLIIARSAVGTLIYELSPLGREIMSVIDIDAALQERR